jgi:hypothetical protein
MSERGKALEKWADKCGYLTNDARGGFEAGWDAAVRYLGGESLEVLESHRWSDDGDRNNDDVIALIGKISEVMNDLD